MIGSRADIPSEEHGLLNTHTHTHTHYNTHNPTPSHNKPSFIFQQIAENNISALKQDIQSQLNLYFPNVAVADLSIDSIPDANQVNVSLTYNIINTGISDNINITFA
jgi:hypothetical protein